MASTSTERNRRSIPAGLTLLRAVVATVFLCLGLPAQAQTNVYDLASRWTAENRCKADGADCMVMDSIQLPRGYDDANVQIFLTKYYIRAVGTTSAPKVNRIKFAVDKSYDKSSGVLFWWATAAFKGDNSNTDLEFGVGFTVVMSDGTSSRMTEMAVTNSGALSSILTKTDELTDPTGGIPDGSFYGFYVKSIEVAVAPPILYVDPSKLYFDVSGSNPKLTWGCGLYAAQSGTVRCSLTLLGMAHGPIVKDLYNRSYDSSMSDDFQPVTLNPRASQWYIGLQSTSAAYRGRGGVGLMSISGGCLRQNGIVGYTWGATIDDGRPATIDQAVKCQEVQLQ